MTARSLLVVIALFAATTTVPALAQEAGQTVGDKIHIRVDELPAPVPAEPPDNTPTGTARPAVPLRVPDGFAATPFRDGVENARNLLVLPDGDVLVAQPNPGTLTLLRDADGDGSAEVMETWASGFEKPFGLAFAMGGVYVGDVQGVWRLPWRTGGTSAAGPRERIVPGEAFGPKGGHHTRTLAFSRDGKRLFVGIGSVKDLAEEPPPRATIQEFAADGSGQKTFADGLRNPVTMAVRPDTDDLYAVVNERNQLGDELVPDFFTRVQPGGFYGWPYAYLGPREQPEFAGKRPDLVAKTLTPDVLFQAHSAPIGMAFADRTNFPQRYKDGAFVTLHGSASRSEPVGFSVVFVPFKGGKPEGGHEVFAAGFLVGTKEGGKPVVWGRPSGLAVAKDGSLLVADTMGSVWRIAYTGKTGKGKTAKAAK
ncbi:PQQ-dependent sugar dehydrogenase [Azospirillum sp. SYSU D00513]|uniref:PQQ-dependent sugar dehydrogenase n=1 Tax=Azospirillum sp. SYSU D00513 TaxID=2812561 RepID=UPI001A95ECBF|nr:PQQ-dependent sugar dehydrogenase [Azospirillum sp. SYSU D00513]